MGRITEAVKHIIIINVILFIAPQLIQGFDLQSMFALYFPENEKFGLVSQLRRASVSIASNLAEGTSRQTNKDKAHFTTMAFGSAVEVINQLILSFELNFISEFDYNKLREELESVTNKLNSLRTFQISKVTENS